jgi:hypothetical protein
MRLFERFAIVIVAAQIAAGATITGTVTDSSGTPIVDARVDHTGMVVAVATTPVPPAAGEIRTDSDGRFRLTTTVPAVVIRKPGYASYRLLISGDAEVQIKLRPMRERLLCKVSPPPKVKTKEQNDSDYSATLYYVETKNGKRGVLSGGGPIYSFGAPSDSYVWKSTEYSEVMYENGMIDASGRSGDRDYWRVRSVFAAEAHYSDVNRETAELLDCVMDRVIPQYLVTR